MDDELARLGRGMVQANLRLGRVLALLESRDPPGTAGALDVLLDLIDAIDQALHHLGDGDVATGLKLARARAMDELAVMGIEPVPEAGALDPTAHHVILVQPAAEAASAGQIARTLRRGWRRDGDPPTVLRPAHVAVWQT